mmetsp:Transcript_7527/g.16400  ORF Transcript_7527/g.16400 Transcript_7527/m.16400 type:complete len:509 (+) Transcript_7527:212-1738(+)
MDKTNGEEFVRYLKRYDAHKRQMRDLKMEDIIPISEGEGIQITPQREEIEESDPNQPFIESMGAPPPPAPKQKKKEGQQTIPCLAYNQINACPDDMNLTHELLNKLVILKLNGGLGTTMGCKGPKSAIEVRNSLSFLDLAVRQIEFLNTKHGVDVPLILMNSFNTDEETKRVVSKYAKRHVSIRTFVQSKFPRCDKTTMTPVTTEKFSHDTRGLWYPPGHGDVYAALARNGLLQHLISMGKEYIFISNIDNLGATVDLNILYHLMENDYKFCMEVTKRERQDISGGTLVELHGKPVLLEKYALPKVLGDNIRRDKRFDKFNTNNIWVNLREMQRLVSVHKSLNLQVIVKEKMTTFPNGTEAPCLTFLTAAGAAISLFDDVCVVSVPRERFLPVKTTDDLFAVQSDLFTVKHGTLHLSEKRTITPRVPTVKLGPCFKTVDEYMQRLPFGVPDIIDLEHLTVSGSVSFRNRIQLKGTVIIVAEEGSHIDICSGSSIRDKVMTGNLRLNDL